ncbi:MAG: FtsX-like permease family protein, partial [Candidatus Latescibacterota bacterium]
MIRHLCRLAWSRRRTHLLLGLETLVALLLVWVIAAVIVAGLPFLQPPPGFDPQDLWWVRLDRSLGAHPGANEGDWVTLQEARAVLEALGPVQQVALDSGPPLAGYGGTYLPHQGRTLRVSSASVSVEACEVLRLNLVAGRWFAVGDRDGVVVTRALARALFGDADPVGQRFGWPGSPRTRLVIGVVDHRHDHSGLGEDPFYYAPMDLEQGRAAAAAGRGWPLPYLVCRMAPGTPRDFEREMRRALRPATASFGIEVESVEERLAEKRRGGQESRQGAMAVAAFVLALVCLGLAGVLLQEVSGRTEEIGVRRAAGATRGRICRQFVGEVLVVVTAAVLLAAVVVAQLVLFDVFPVP